MALRSPKKLVAVVVPLTNRATFTADEHRSLEQITRVLGRYDKYLLAPKGLKLAVPGYSLVRFPQRFFGSGMAHSQLMMSRPLYQRFRDYQFILVHHLDAFVFADELEQWCAAGYDFIGAPWLRSSESPAEGFAGVGNGGFSLRRVDSFLQVLSSSVYMIDPAEYRRRWQERYGGRNLFVRLLNAPRLALKRVRAFNSVRQFTTSYALNEDHFWADEARHYYADLRIAPPELALRFAFEQAPRYAYHRLGRLPFGCHGWPTNDRAFWEPLLAPVAPEHLGT